MNRYFWAEWGESVDAAIEYLEQALIGLEFDEREFECLTPQSISAAQTFTLSALDLLRNMPPELRALVAMDTAAYAHDESRSDAGSY